MALIRKAIVDVLRADAPLTTLLGGDEKVYHRSAPPDAQMPFVLVEKQAGVPDYTFGDFHENELWTVQAIDKGLTALQADEINEAVKAALQDAPLDIDDYELLWCRREQDVDYGEREEGTLIHHVGAMYRILREPA